MEDCLSLAKSSEFDIDQCIICQKKSKVSLTSTENGRKRINDFKMVTLTKILSTTLPIPASKIIR